MVVPPILRDGAKYFLINYLKIWSAEPPCSAGTPERARPSLERLTAVTDAVAAAVGGTETGAEATSTVAAAASVGSELTGARDEDGKVNMVLVVVAAVVVGVADMVAADMVRVDMTILVAADLVLSAQSLHNTHGLFPPCF